MTFIKNKKAIIYGVFLAVSVFLVLFNTAMSPLYTVGYMPHDTSVFYVIGRGIKAGLSPYKDLFDHKGIYIYFFYYLAAIIGERNQIGLFIVFTFVVYLFMIIIYKIVILFDKSDSKLASIFSTILLTIIMMSFDFSLAGLHCEHIAIITILISMYMMLKYIKMDNCKGFKPKYMFINGILAGVNVFNKTNYILYFIAVGLYALYDILYINKKNGILLKNIIFGIIGVIIGILPGIIYCAVNGIFNDMIFATFILNFKYIDDFKVDISWNINTKFEGFLHCLYAYKYSLIIIILSLVICYKKAKNVYKFSILSFVFIVTSVLCSLKGYSYYRILFLPYYLPFIFFIYKKITGVFNKNNHLLSNAIKFISIFLFILISYFSGHVRFVNMHKFDAIEALKAYTQIKKYSANSNCKILCYGIGEYHYNFLGIIPSEKYFYIPTISYNLFSEPYDELQKVIKNYEYDIVIFEVNDFIYNNSIETVDFLNNNYDCIMNYNKCRRVYAKSKSTIK